MAEEKESVEIFVSGRVQGVGYRAFAEREAAMLGLTGFVRNLPDGRVQLEAEGNRRDLEKLIDRLWKGPGNARVKDIQVLFDQAKGKFTGFTTRY
jgi:acylphosphatase